MKIVTENPPYNIREICEDLFDLKEVLPVWTFGDTIYNPHKQPLSVDLLAHERKHTHQQGNKPVEWWYNYVNDPDFRFKQELEAYQVQYRFLIGSTNNRQERFKHLRRLANDLSGPMYGNMCTTLKAITLIKNEGGEQGKETRA